MGKNATVYKKERGKKVNRFIDFTSEYVNNAGISSEKTSDLSKDKKNECIHVGIPKSRIHK